jgi:hypothetical protein
VRRREHREKVRRDLSDQLDRLFEDKRRSPRDIAKELEVEVIPDEPPRIPAAIVDQLLDRDDSIPLLNGLIRQLSVRDAVEILENCMDLILPFHFSPKAVAAASSCRNEKGGGVLNKIVMTKCGAELVMAAVNQFDARHNPNDPELVGEPAISGDFPALGKMSIDDDAKRFLASVMGTDSEESQARRLDWDRKDRKRTTYCIVRLPTEPADRDHALKLYWSARASVSRSFRFSSSRRRARPRIMRKNTCVCSVDALEIQNDETIRAVQRPGQPSRT